jgi:hypothetical protein
MNYTEGCTNQPRDKFDSQVTPKQLTIREKLAKALQESEQQLKQLRFALYEMELKQQNIVLLIDEMRIEELKCLKL